MGSVMTIGIAGGTGSGKTTITRRLLQKFSSNVSVIYHDNYYKAHNDLNYEQRSLLNYDCPDAFDTELMLRDLKRLRAGGRYAVRSTTTPSTTARTRRCW